MEEQKEEKPEETSEESSVSTAESEDKPAEKKDDKAIGAGKKVLIVDDDPSSAELLKGILEKAEFEVLLAGNGQEGLAKASGEKPNLIVADVIMPEMDGYGFFKELKKNDDTAGIAVVIVSIRKNMADSFLAMGAEAFIPKPVDPQALLAKISEVHLIPREPKKEEAAEGEEGAGEGGEENPEEAKEEKKE